jgi:toxin FitB
MIILDTNVVSEPMKRLGNPAVQAWLDRQTAETLYLTATSLSELLVGIMAIPQGSRKNVLAMKLEELLGRLFADRILPFDQRAAVTYASLVSRARTKGQSISVADGQIAAIAQVHGFAVATRDEEPFLAVGVRVINPWNE